MSLNGRVCLMERLVFGNEMRVIGDSFGAICGANVACGLTRIAVKSVKNSGRNGFS
jgi:hypothetical protein